MSKGEVRTINGKRRATPEYNSWQHMKNRVLNPRCPCYDRYGGRGIWIDEKWLDFDNFLADMGRKPTKKHTLERIDNEDGYYASNCKWATRREQARNRGTYHTLDPQLADMIRTLYATGQYRQIDIARHFGLTQTDISQITRNVRWARDKE